MKKIFLAAAVIGLIAATSCKNDNSKDIESEIQQTTDDASQQAENLDAGESDVKQAIEETVEVPKFDDEEVQKFADDYAGYIRELLLSSKKGDVDKTVELTKQGMEWDKKANEIAKKMNDTDKQKWVDWTNQLRDLINTGE